MAILRGIMPITLDHSALRATLGIRNFAVFTAGNSLSMVGTWVQRVAVGWLTWELTHSALWLGTVSMAEFIPSVFLAPIIGVMADRFDRRRIAVIGQMLAMVQALLLAGLTISGHITAAIILALQIFSGVLQPMMQTARLVLVPTLVPRENLGHAIAVTSFTFNLSRIIGPAVAGALIAAFGAGYAFLLNGVSYFFVITALVKLNLPPHQAVPSAHASLFGGIWTDFSEGLRYTFGHPGLRWVIFMITVSGVLTWPVTDFLAGIADHEFARGVGGLAALASAQGIGAVCGSIFLAQRKGSSGTAILVAWAVLLNGLSLAAFAVTKIFWLALIILAANGMLLVMGGAGSQTVVQSEAAEHMRGRTLSIWFTLTRVGPALGALGLGSLASIFGFTGPLLAAGLLAAAIASINWRGQHAAAPEHH